MALAETHRSRFLFYPKPVYTPSRPTEIKRKPKPRLRGWPLVIITFLLEWLGFFRRHAWRGAHFGALSRIAKQIEDVEPRFDPTVFPLDESHQETVQTPGKEDRNQAVLRDQNRTVDSERKNSVARYRSLFLSGELTPLNVAQAILPLIRRDTSPPGEYSVAWISVRADLVLAAAEASTLRYKNGQSLGELDGIPTAVKDEFDMEGYATTLGSIHDYTCKNPDDEDMNAWCVRKLQQAGAVIFGKLSMHEFGLDTSGNNIFYGTPRNPYNPQYYTGGSSSGPAFAVATGLIPFALGSDGGGSIRMPSSYCGVFGLKPTHGRISFFPVQNHSNTCSVNGPIGADVQSLASMYAVISEPDPSSYFPKTTQSQRMLSLTSSSLLQRSKTIAVPEAWFKRASPAMQKLCRRLIDRLVAQKGYNVISIDIPYLAEGQVAHSITILNDGATLLPYPEGTRDITAANRLLLALARETPATHFLLAAKLRHVLMRHLAWLWQQHGSDMLIVTPTTRCAGWPIRDEAAELRGGLNDGSQTLATMEFVWLANFCGVPSLTVPAGFVVPETAPHDKGEVASPDTPGKIPVGLMATAEWAAENTLLAFGSDIEEVSAEVVRGDGDGAGVASASGFDRPPNWVDIEELARRKRREEQVP